MTKGGGDMDFAMTSLMNAPLPPSSLSHFRHFFSFYPRFKFNPEKSVINDQIKNAAKVFFHSFSK